MSFCHFLPLMQLLNAVGVEAEYLLCDYFRGMSDLRLWCFGGHIAHLSNRA